jgi:hypothetical protein
MALLSITLDHEMIRNDKEDNKDEKKKNNKKMWVLKGCLLNNGTTKKRFGVECKFIVKFLKETIKKLTIQEHTMHGRLKELPAGPSKRGPERW